MTQDKETKKIIPKYPIKSIETLGATLFNMIDEIFSKNEELSAEPFKDRKKKYSQKLLDNLVTFNNSLFLEMSNKDFKKKWKVMMHEDVMKDMDNLDIPEEVEQELAELIKGFKDGTIDPAEVGEPIDLEELERDEPDVYKKLKERFGDDGKIT